MDKEVLKSIVSLVIIGAVFLISAGFIFQQQYELDKQIAAIVSFPEPEEDGGASGQLTGRLAGQAKKIFLSNCLNNAFDNFENLWNQECEKQGLEEKCSLPDEVAKKLIDDYQQVKDDCYKKYN